MLPCKGELYPSTTFRVTRNPSDSGRGRRGHKPPRGKPTARHARKKAAPSRRRRGAAGPSKLTSHPTSRNALMETRAWLLDQHGPVCAYCGRRHTAAEMTLDHVAPRRGQTAYDRRDNLVLACKTCNAAKRDLAPLAFLLALRTRAANLLRYGAHLSAGLIDLAKSLLSEHEIAHAHSHHGRAHAVRKRVKWNEKFSDDDSPYRS